MSLENLLSLNPSSGHLLLHGAIVLVYALLLGAPYGRSVNRGEPERTVAAWRLAHSSLIVGAMLMLITALVLPALALPSSIKWLMAVSLIVSSYSFCIALTVAPIVGHRGLSSGGPVSARLVYFGNLLGAGGSLVAAVGLLCGAFLSL